MCVTMFQLQIDSIIILHPSLISWNLLTPIHNRTSIDTIYICLCDEHLIYFYLLDNVIYEVITYFIQMQLIFC